MTQAMERLRAAHDAQRQGRPAAAPAPTPPRRLPPPPLRPVVPQPAAAEVPTPAATAPEQPSEPTTSATPPQTTASAPQPPAVAEATAPPQTPLPAGTASADARSARRAEEPAEADDDPQTALPVPPPRLVAPPRGGQAGAEDLARRLAILPVSHGRSGPNPTAPCGPDPAAIAPGGPGIGQRLALGGRRAARRLLLVMLILSLLGTVEALARIAATPGLSPLVDRGQDEIAAAMDRAMARSATPARLTERLDTLIGEPERNWVAIDAVMAVAEERGVLLPPELLVRIDAAQSADEGLIASASGCLACMADPAACQLSAQLLCQAPMVLTPAGDLVAVGGEALSWARGEAVDRINLTLGLVGLGATAAILATGGTSAPVKVGAAALRTARGMGLVSARLGAMVARAADEGIDWARLRALKLGQLGDRAELARLLRPAALSPLRDTATALGRIDAAVGPRATLALLARIDGATDARRIANAAEALGPRTLGRMEVLGKGRFLRATVRLSNLAIQVIGSMVVALLAMAGLAGSMCSSLALRAARRGLARI